jgi:DHA1 family multidrug resistance protein-like MFS transporter
MPTWRRTFWAVFAANLITSIGMLSFLPFFPTLLEERLGVSEPRALYVWTGVLFGAAPLSAALMGPIWGSVGDRIGRKLMVLRAMAAIALFVGVMGWAHTPWQCLALRIGQGVFSGFIPPSITLVSIAAPREMQGRVAGALQSALALGAILGPLLGAQVQKSWGVQCVFFVVAALAGVSALLIALFTVEDPSLRMTLEGWSPTSALGHAWADLRAVCADRLVRGAVVVTFLIQLGLGATSPLMEFLVREQGVADPRELADRTAWLFTALSAAGLVGNSLWGRWGDRAGHARALSHASVATALVFAAHVWATTWAPLVGVRVLLGCASAGPNAAAYGIAATRTGTERRGSAFGLVFSARALAVASGAVGGGALASWIGIRALFALVAATLLGAILWLRPVHESRKDV